MANVLLVSESKSFMVASLTQQLEEVGHNVIQTINNPNEIGKIKDEIQLVLLYVEELVVEGLVYLKDKVIEENIPIFVIGDKEQIEEVETVIPKQFIKKNILRPINVKDVVGVIDKYLKEDESHMKKKILVVDDSGAVLRNVKGWLQDKYQVILANSGAMAIKYLALNRPDLVLLDYEMPICDGRQVLEMIRAESDFSDMSVIFLTSKSDRESVMKVTALKPDGYLLKTMEPNQIVQAIDDFFEKKKLEKISKEL